MDHCPFVSVIILNHNNRQYLVNCLRSVENLVYSTANLEIIVADNDSSDGSVEFVRENFPAVKTITFKANHGFAKGNNLAVEQARGEYVAFLNPDTEVEAKWLTELVDVMRSDENLACCGGKVLFLDHKGVIQNAGHRLTPIGIGYGIGFAEEDSGRFDSPRRTLAASACCMLVRRDIFMEVGGFDPDYFMYLEEIDLGLRFWLSGFEVAYVPESVAYHKLGGGFASQVTPLHVYQYEKNRLATIVKDFEFVDILMGFGISVPYVGHKILSFALQRKVGLLWALARGQFAFAANLPSLLRKRRTVQRARKRSDRQLRELGLVAGPMEAFRDFLELRRRARPEGARDAQQANG